MNLVEKVDINGLIRKHESDYYYKSFKTSTHLLTMLFGILSRCDSMTEVCEGLRAMGRNPEGDGKEKGGLKVHGLIDAAQSVARFIKITAAKLTEQKLLKNLEMPIIIKSGAP